MPNYICPDCGHSCEEPICPMCGAATERIDDVDDVTGESLEKKEKEKYPLDELEKVADEEELDMEETNEKNKEL